MNYNCGVYSIRASSGNLYIGPSQNIRKRWREHRNDLKRGRHHSVVLQKAFDKYQDTLEYTLLLVCNPKDLVTYEQQYIDFYKPKYNICLIAGSCLGFKHTDETRQKMSEAHKGMPVSEESRRKIALSKIGKPRPQHVIDAVKKALTGRRLSEAKKQNLREKMGGKNHPNWGKKHSEETKAKISEKARSRFRLRREES